VQWWQQPAAQHAGSPQQSAANAAVPAIIERASAQLNNLVMIILLFEIIKCVRKTAETHLNPENSVQNIQIGLAFRDFGHEIP
jgi:hypothetical protein